MGRPTLDAVLPLARKDLRRAQILLQSLDHFDAPIGNLWVVTPDANVDRVAARLAGATGLTVLADTEVIPEIAGFEALPDGWFVQQLVKLAVAERIDSAFYLTLDADVICVRAFEVADLVVDGRGISNRRTGPRFEPEWYGWAARVLEMPESNYVHGVTPAVLSVEAVLGLQRHLGSLFDRGSWRRYLLESVPWTEYVLYFTWLEATGRYDRYHFAGEHGADTIYGNSLWLPDQDLASWDAEAIFGHDVPFQFAVVQSNHPTISTDDVIARVGPFIGMDD